MQSEHGNIVAIGRGDNKPEIVKDASLKDVEALVAKALPGHADRLRQSHARIDAVAKEVLGDPDLTGEYVQFALAAAERDRILNDDLAPRPVEEMEKRVAQYHRLVDVGSVIIWEHAEYRGSARFLSFTYPNLGWAPFCFNDKASSAIAWGANILFEHSWYRGRRLYLIGVVRFPDLNVFGFNDLASSFVAL